MEPHFGGESRPPPYLPSGVSWSTGRAIPLPVSSFHGWSVRPPTDLVFVVSPRALPARRNCLVSFGELVERRLVVRRRRAPLVGRWE